MKILFWNIGPHLNEKKLQLLSEAITKEMPDIFCVAEGTYSIPECQQIMDKFSEHNYCCYYSPLSYKQTPKLLLNDKWNRNGLKIFVKGKSVPKEDFAFSNQREEGRIVTLKTVVNSRPTVLVFLHNKSKLGNREVTDDQKAFILSLSSMMRNILEVAEDKGRIIIIGDFNLEPWDNILRNKIFIDTCFFPVHNTISQRKKHGRQYYNPLVEVVFQTNIENLGGTYFKDAYGWALYDYILYDTKDSNITYGVITGFTDGSALLNNDASINSDFINDQFDHLPIIAKINN